MPPDEPPPLPPELVAELTALAETVAARADHADIAARLEWLIDALILRDQLPASFRRLAAKVKGQGDRSVVRLATFRDKYAIASPDLDCAARIPLCGARCCSFEVTSPRRTSPSAASRSTSSRPTRCRATTAAACA